MRKKYFTLLSIAFALASCSSEDEATVNAKIQDDGLKSVAGLDDETKPAALWRSFAKEGVSGYLSDFNENHQDAPFNVFRRDTISSCGANALKMDDGTIYMDELESLFMEGSLVEGVCGKALSLKSGEVAPLGVNLLDSMKTGTVEFWFRPGEDFYDQFARTLLGNDEARMHFFMQDGELVFQKNHADQHFFVKGSVELKNDWNLIGGQWGDGFLSLWVNGELVARVEHDLGYAPSLRGVEFGNLVVIGYKSGCCMEGPGQYGGMTTSGDFDQFRISKVLRYDNGVAGDGAIEVSADTLVKDSVDEISVFESSSSEEVIESSSSAELDSSVCSENALKFDDQTLYFDEMDTVRFEGTLIDGVCGKAVRVAPGEKAKTSISLEENLEVGTVEFWFRPGENFYDESSRTILGNDEARVHFFMQNGKLVFQKNHADKHFFVKGDVEFLDDWNLIAGQWGDGFLSLWVNGKLVARIDHNDGYEPSTRGKIEGNLIVAGYKSDCCMEGPDQNSSMVTSGDFDQVRVSKVARYDNASVINDDVAYLDEFEFSASSLGDTLK